MLDRRKMPFISKMEKDVRVLLRLICSHEAFDVCILDKVIHLKKSRSSKATRMKLQAGKVVSGIDPYDPCTVVYLHSLSCFSDQGPFLFKTQWSRTWERIV